MDWGSYRVEGKVLTLAFANSGGAFGSFDGGGFAT